MNYMLKNKIVMSSLGIAILSVILLFFTGAVSPIKANENPETISDLFFSNEDSNEPIVEELTVKNEVTLAIHSLNEKDEVVQLELPEGMQLKEEETIKKNEERTEKWFSQEGQTIAFNLTENEEHISVAKIVIEVIETKSYQLLLTTDREGSIYQSPPINLIKLNSRAPRIGNLNMDMDISPVQNTIQAGTDAIYKLNLKTTGAMTNYKDALLIVTLPNEANFIQDLSELTIAGIQPEYNGTNKTLTYRFPELVTGQAYQVNIRVTPPNGVTPNNTKLTATSKLSATNFAEVTDTADAIVTADIPISVTKSYVGIKDKQSDEGARPGDVLIWKIKANIASRTTGLLYLKEGEQLTISDTLDSTVTYEGGTSTSTPNVNGSTLTWSFDTPTIVSQKASEQASASAWSTEFLVYTKVVSGVPDFTEIKNKVELKAIGYDNTINTKVSNEAKTSVVRGGDIIETPSGSWYVPSYWGPGDSLGNNGTVQNPVPTVTDAAKLQFSYAYLPALWGEEIYASQDKKTPYLYNFLDVYNLGLGYKDISIHEEIDPNLIFESILISKPRSGSVNTADTWGDLKQMPVMTLKLQVNTTNNWVNYVIDTSRFKAEDWFTLTREEIGLAKGDHLISYEINYKNKDGSPIEGNFRSGGSIRAYYSVKKGYVGPVTNRLWFSGWVNGQSTPFYIFPNGDKSDSIIGPRSANVLSPSTYLPVMRVSIGLNTTKSGVVEVGNNRVTVYLDNDSSSMVNLNKKLGVMILLPEGVTFKDIPKDNYLDSQGYFTKDTPDRAKGGNYTIVSNNYNNTGQQLVKVIWNDEFLPIGRWVGFGADVQIAETAPSPLNFEVYGFSGDEKLAVPTGSSTITGYYLETDTGDLNGDGNKTQNMVKSGNSYIMLRDVNVETEKLVKGESDSVYSKFGHTVPGGKIEYQLKMTNTNNEPVTAFTLMDVLPSVGDLGITDGANRGSTFTPTMTGPITVPTEWANKVTVLYSTAVNPKRDDLVKNVSYPDTTQKLSNPASATTPNWQAAAAVTDWSTIHSFKIELNSGVSWVKGQEITLDFSMKAPAEAAITDKSILDPSKDEKTRAAWNSFAYAQNTMQVVEPERVGVVMNSLGKVNIQKIDAANAATKLAGAIFVIGTTEDQLKSENYIKVDGEGTLIYPGDINYSTSLKNYEVVTNVQGLATFEKLRLDGSNGNKYYLKEIKAPNGYQLLTKNIEVTASLEVTPAAVSITNIKKFNMPQTGSVSLVLILLIGAGLVGTGGMRYIKQQRNSTVKTTKKTKKRRGNHL